VLVLALGAVFAPVLAPFPYDEVHEQQMASPGRPYWLGADQFGRDTLSRLLYGGRVSFLVAVLSAFFSMVLGVALGAVAGYRGGVFGDLLMRAMDVILAFPYIILAIALAWVIGPSLFTVIVVITVIGIPQFARLTRGTVLTIRELPFIEAERALGQQEWRILLSHVLPNAFGPIVVYATLLMGVAVNTEAALSFLGLGIQPPLPSWGTMLSEGRRFVYSNAWLVVFPGLAISLAVIGFNLVGDGLRDRLDPRLRKDS
jgi:ABC-type dipeptide/oligopeptide/nickel transport system permease subunit